MIPGVDLLACPLTGLTLREVTVDAAEASAGGPFVARSGGGTPRGRTPTVLLREDNGAAYPVDNGIPVLLGPERLQPAASGPFQVDLADARYAEAYEEMAFYNEAAAQVEETVHAASFPRLTAMATLGVAGRRQFPEPASLWLDATYESTAQLDAYRHLAPLDGTRILQLGGKGEQAVVFLLAGAEEAWVVSPMVGELAYARALARRFGVDDRLRCAAGVAEELPLQTARFDRIWAKSMHHTIDALSYPQCARVLRPGGRMAAVEPWRALLHTVGTKVLGKRERGVTCKPVTADRLGPFHQAFSEAEVVRHGAFLRYPMIAIEKFGVTVSLSTALRIGRIDDRIGRVLPGVRNPGSCAALLAATA